MRSPHLPDGATLTRFIFFRPLGLGGALVRSLFGELRWRWEFRRATSLRPSGQRSWWMRPTSGRPHGAKQLLPDTRAPTRICSRSARSPALRPRQNQVRSQNRSTARDSVFRTENPNSSQPIWAFIHSVRRLRSRGDSGFSPCCRASILQYTQAACKFRSLSWARLTVGGPLDSNLPRILILDYFPVNLNSLI